MAQYLVLQIILGALTYQQIITKRPDLKERIDKYIKDNGLEDEIDKTK